MAQIQLTVCDVDKTEFGKETQHYTINTPGGRSELDLCVDHAQPIEQILEVVYGGKVPHPTAPAKKATAPKKTAAPRRRGSAKIMTLEEIEAMKQS
ncbi:hypothetical protein KGG93_gp29 [Streptomyces phage Endor2]|uniref:Lsr2-like DNA bridging protein n=1 Tax=Streptomyces phage Endor2 TaxID=2740182 RepID=A0A7G4AX34_9CAUD|nr:hypothetical protein KGG93_gp29 [Streptomyces phage Endor2]QMP84574.1 hypothetical protein HUN44_00029 [Streptomyces phage Endor2]